MAPQPQPCKRFIKVILDFNIEIKKLRLPLKFVRLYGNELANRVKLFTPDSRVWEMKVIREEGHIWLENGFHEFSQLHSLKHGHQVHFKYKGMSNFGVRIFDMSACLITYPPLENASKAPPKPKPKSKPKPKPKKLKAPCKKTLDLCNYRSESGLQSPRHFKSSRPHFLVNLKAYNSSLNVVYVLPEFSREHFMETRAEYVKLETCDEREWKVALKRKKTGRFSFGKGWNQFSKENGLKEKDVCIFELSKKTAFKFKVYVFVAI